LLDNARFGWSHIRACVVSGIGFFTDAYDIFAINLVSTMIGYVYWPDNKTPSNVDTAIKISLSAGTVVGQLLFGYLADRVGRKRMYGIELMIIIVGTVGQTLAGNSQAISFWATIVLWRIIVGVGVGGDYPLSSVITSEFASTKRRGAMMAAVFAMQGIGQVTASIVGMIATFAFRNAIDQDKRNLDYVWRIVVGVGAILGLLALYYRLTLPETLVIQWISKIMLKRVFVMPNHLLNVVLPLVITLPSLMNMFPIRLPGLTSAITLVSGRMVRFCLVLPTLGLHLMLLGTVLV